MMGKLNNMNARFPIHSLINECLLDCKAISLYTLLYKNVGRSIDSIGEGLETEAINTNQRVHSVKFWCPGHS